MCLWANDPTSNLQWVRGSGEVTEAAPETDVTLGNQFGTYLYVHTLFMRDNVPFPARLISPYFPSAKKRCVNFWNFRNGTEFDGALLVSVYFVERDDNIELLQLSQEKLGRWNNDQVQIDQDEDEGKYEVIFSAEMSKK